MNKAKMVHPNPPLEWDLAPRLDAEKRRLIAKLAKLQELTDALRENGPIDSSLLAQYQRLCDHTGEIDDAVIRSSFAQVDGSIASYLSACIAEGAHRSA
ncbi:hypothetical protein [Devosia sediminis]|uniref:Uncharacterized protein n=1 Tax=Devosia sediminis TaxID=2798801 RepID=A0A934IX56_9HYPH|nr:hypothetical protein [Devosia sediminis]MBJ3783860.1 hypothetical protein [Devosia sediminis]